MGWGAPKRKDDPPMNITVHYISDIDGVLTVAFCVNGKLCSIVAGECTFVDKCLIILRDSIFAYNTKGLET